MIEIQWKAIDRRVKDFLTDTIWWEFPRFRSKGTHTSPVRIRFDKNTIQRIEIDCEMFWLNLIGGTDRISYVIFIWLNFKEGVSNGLIEFDLWNVYLIEFDRRFVQGADRNGFVKFVWLNLMRFLSNALLEFD